MESSGDRVIRKPKAGSDVRIRCSDGVIFSVPPVVGFPISRDGGDSRDEKFPVMPRPFHATQFEGESAPEQR